ncbi:MAG: cytochrome C [Desulfuromonas sp.]|nr:MAG: cytochrome C [Desulfuromonas sp.]
MDTFKSIFDSFFRGIARSRISLIGAMLTTVTFPFLLGLILIDIWGHIENPYFGAVVYMMLGPAFMLGLVMVFIGLFFLKGKEEVRVFTVGYLREHFTDEARFNRVRKLIFLGVFLTCTNFFIISMLGYSGYHYMESNSFCGQFCHEVMHPEYTAYQNSPHSRVHCVECHIGSGATWFVKSKISGSRQLFAVAFDTVPRPIKTPVHGLRPARETCEQCHRPDKFHGDTLKVKNKYLDDEASTPTQTVMLMKIGSAGSMTEKPHGIHWHVSKDNKITYKADPNRMTIPEVTLTRADGSSITYRSDDAPEGAELEERAMDCIDCHNRPTHIYRDVETAVNEKIFSGEISIELPYIKRQAIELLTKEYATNEEAMSAISSNLRDWYGENYPQLTKEHPELLDRSVEGVRSAYSQNVFPEMKITWGTYVNHIGHGEDFDIGCFRCHDDSHESENGETISGDCNLCHVLLAEDETDPEILETLTGE